MQSEEPSACLVYSLVDEVGGESQPLVYHVAVLKRIVYLCVWHGTRVEPNVDEVALALHGLSALADEHYLVYVWTVQVDAVVVLLRIVARHEAFVLQRIAFHHAGSHCFLYLLIEFLKASDANLLAVLVAPYRQRCAPEARTRQVPVVKVLKPVAETSGTGRLWLPVDGLVELKHTVFLSRRAYEPRVEGIVEHGLVGAPAVRIVVRMLLQLEGRTLLFHLHRYDNVQVLGLRGCFLVVLATLVEAWVVGVFHVVACMMGVCRSVYAGRKEILVEVGNHIVLTFEVYHRPCFALLVYEEQAWDACIFCHLGIVGTECRGNVYYARTVFGGHIVAGNNAESLRSHLHEGVLAVLALENLVGMGSGVCLHKVGSVVVDLSTGLHPRHELAEAQAHEVGSLVAAYDAVGHKLLALVVVGQFLVVGNQSLGIEICSHASLCHDDRYLLGIVAVVGFHCHVVNLRAHAEGCVRRQCPRCCGPCHEVGLAPTGPLRTRLLHFKECSDRHVLHVAVATGLVQLVARQSRTCCRAVGLYGIAFIKQVLVIELAQQPPEGLYVLIVVCDIRMVEIYEVSHLLRQVAPLCRELHHVLAAAFVIFLSGDIARACLVVDVGLGYSKFLLHAQLHRQAVCVPAGLAVYLEAAHGLVAVEGVLDASCQHVMYARMAVGRWRSLVEYKLRTALALGYALVEDVAFHPLCQDLLVSLGEVQPLVFGKSLSHNISFLLLMWQARCRVCCKQANTQPNFFKVQKYKK